MKNNAAFFCVVETAKYSGPTKNWPVRCVIFLNSRVKDSLQDSQRCVNQSSVLGGVDVIRLTAEKFFCGRVNFKVSTDHERVQVSTGHVHFIRVFAPNSQDL